MEMPTRPRSGFNSPAVKKAYRALARKYHPDKVTSLPEDEQEGAGAKWLGIARAYETLTDETKFQNWLDFGNPDGSLSSRALQIEIAMPSFLLDTKNQLYLLVTCFACLVLVPLVVIARSDSTTGDESDFVAELDRYEYRELRKKAELAEKKRRRLEEEAAYQNDPAIKAQRAQEAAAKEATKKAKKEFARQQAREAEERRNAIEAARRKEADDITAKQNQAREAVTLAARRYREKVGALVVLAREKMPGTKYDKFYIEELARKFPK